MSLHTYIFEYITHILKEGNMMYPDTYNYLHSVNYWEIVFNSSLLRCYTSCQYKIIMHTVNVPSSVLNGTYWELCCL